MHLTVLSYIGDEEDIVEDFIRHTATFADSIHVVSTGSDSTSFLLNSLLDEGIPLTIQLHEPAFHDQHIQLSRHMQSLKSSTDWLIPLDADEFISGDIRAVLSASNAPRAFPWRTYVPQRSDSAVGPVHRRITHRRSMEHPQFTKIAIPSSFLQTDHYITQGNHAVADSQSRIGGIPVDDVFIAHFPVRSATQLLAKIRRSWAAVERNPNRLSNEAQHWRIMFERYGHLESLDDETVRRVALRYAWPDDEPDAELVEDPLA